MFNGTLSGYVTKAGAEVKNFKGQSCLEFKLQVKHDNGMQSSLLTCKIWGKRGESVASYIHPGDVLTVVGRMGSITQLPASAEGGKGLVCMNMNVDDFQLPKAQGAVAKATPKREDPPALEDDDEIPF